MKQTWAIARSMMALLGMFLLFNATAFAHDRFEITTQVFLHTNRLEIHAILARNAMNLLVAEEGRATADLATPDGFDTELPRLKQASANFFRLTAGGYALAMVETNVNAGVEDHIDLNLVYLLPERNPLRIEAMGLNKLPSDEGYGVVATILDMVNKKVLGQKVLTATDSVMEVTLVNASDEIPIVTQMSGPSSGSRQMTPAIAETTPLQSNTTNKRLLLFVVIALVVLLAGWRMAGHFRSSQ